MISVKNACTRTLQRRLIDCNVVLTCFRLKANMNVNLKLDLYHNNDLLEHAEDKKLLSQLGLKDKNVRAS